MNFPASKRETIIDTLHGIEVSDPYRWLEDGSDPEVTAWIEAQNTRTEFALRNQKQQIFSQDLLRDFNDTIPFAPTPANGYYFYRERNPGEDFASLYFKKGIEGTPQAIVDLNVPEMKGTAASLDYYFTGKTGEYVACGISRAGTEMATLYVYSMKDGAAIESIPFCRYSSLQWLPDDSGFYYTRNPRPGAVSENESQLHMKVFLHMIGQDHFSDKCIFGEGRPKEDLISLSLASDGRQLAIHVGQSLTENEVFLYDCIKEELTPLILGIPAQFKLHFLRDKALLYTNYKANNYRVLSVARERIREDIETWDDFCIENEHLLTRVAITADKILLEYVANVSSRVDIYDHEGNKTGIVPLPLYSTLSELTARITEKEFFYAVTSFLYPRKIFRHNPDTGKHELYAEGQNPIDPEDFEVRQEWYISKDSTRIPLYIVRKKNIELDGTNPTILSGYGGFSSVQMPGFLRNWLPWLRRGGVYVVANIRGGGEFGKSWHDQGIKEKKQNSFDDFNAAAEHLIQRGITDSKHLGSVGGSNGGLLVTAAALLRPDLFGAICAHVPLTDMIRFSRFGIARRWVHEYGNPENKHDLETILKWSPYHNVIAGVEYPSMLFTTAQNDTRVDPLHARKMAALLQVTNRMNDILLYTEGMAGHKKNKSISKIIDMQSIVLAFFAEKLVLKF